MQADASDEASLVFGKGQWLVAATQQAALTFVRLIGIGAALFIIAPDATLIRVLLFTSGWGAADAWVRIGWPRNVSHIAVNSERFTVHAGGRTISVPWRNLLAIESWRRMMGYCFVVVHVTHGQRMGIARYACCQQSSLEDLDNFIAYCAEQVRGHFRGRHETVLASWADKSVLWSYVRRICIDVAASLILLLTFSVRGSQLVVAGSYPIVSAIVTALFQHPIRRRTYTADQMEKAPRRLHAWLRLMNDSTSACAPKP